MDISTYIWFFASGLGALFVLFLIGMLISMYRDHLEATKYLRVEKAEEKAQKKFAKYLTKRMKHLAYHRDEFPKICKMQVDRKAKHFK
jgi:hypothetical protein